MDLKVIADALAARFDNVTATKGSETETATATASLPNSVAKLALLVYPPTGTLTLDMGPFIDDHYDFTVRLLRDPVDMETRTQWLYAWATALRTKVQQKVNLNLPGVVDEATARTIRVAIDGQQYSSTDGTFAPYDVVEIVVDVHVHELTTIG